MLHSACRAWRWFKLRPVFARMRARADIHQLIKDATMPSTLIRYHEHLTEELARGSGCNADLTWGRGYTQEAHRRLTPHAIAALLAMRPKPPQPRGDGRRVDPVTGRVA